MVPISILYIHPTTSPKDTCLHEGGEGSVERAVVRQEEVEGEREPQEKRGVEEEKCHQHLGHVHAHVDVDPEGREPAINAFRYLSSFVEEYQN